MPDPRLAEGYNRDGALELISTLPNGSVLCSHGDVIPDVMAALQRRRTEIIGDPDWRKGTVWVLEREDGEINQASVWAPPATD
jgi:8-oxo-dGTP diphosphatase